MRSLEEDEILTDAGLRELLNISRTTLWRLRKNDGLPYGKIGREYRYRKSEVLDWMRSHGAPSVPEVTPAREDSVREATSTEGDGRDIFSPEKRSQIMSRVRSENTKPELTVRSVLHRLGYRFRVHVKALPGRPDIVLPKHNCVVFVHGCFWHQHERCHRAKLPQSRAAWWKAKLEGNVARDLEVQAKLQELGWRVVVIWECQTENTDTLVRLLADLRIDRSDTRRDTHRLPEREEKLLEDH